MAIYRQTIQSILGTLTLIEENGAITEICFGEKIVGEEKETALLTKLKTQLEEYFAGERKVFDVAISPKGTMFERIVWEEMRKIGYGEVCSYGRLAQRIGRSKAARAVGGACHRNRIPIVIPCHRVVGARDIGGFAPGVEYKRILLELEEIRSI